MVKRIVMRHGSLDGVAMKMFKHITIHANLWISALCYTYLPLLAIHSFWHPSFLSGWFDVFVRPVLVPIGLLTMLLLSMFEILSWIGDEDTLTLSRKERTMLKYPLTMSTVSYLILVIVVVIELLRRHQSW